MSLTLCPDPSAASWLAQTPQPWQRLVEFGAAGLAAYARLRFIPDPQWPGQQESDVPAADDLLPEDAQLRAALRVLARHTSTPGDCYFCLWDGWGLRPSPPAAEPAAAVVELPHRRYFLYRGAWDQLGNWGALSSAEASSDWSPLPAFVWPADHAWCLARDVDPHFAGIGGGADAVRELLAEPGLDVVAAPPGEEVPHYY